MFFQRWRVEEDLQRIHDANLPPKQEDAPGEDAPSDPETDADAGRDAARMQRETTPANAAADAKPTEKAPARPRKLPDPDEPERVQLEKGDTWAMILAAFSVVLPYVLIFIGVIGGIVLLLYFFVLK